MDAAMRWLDVLFGTGDSDYPFWLLTVRLNILVFVLCSAVLVGWSLWPPRLRRAGVAWADVGIATAATAIAGLLRLVVEHNLSDYGGIGYSRILLGYKGHFGTAQLYSLVYTRTARDLEHAILLNRIASTLTVPLVYALCRRLAPARRAFATITAALVALHPLLVLFSATDALPISTSLVAAASYLLLTHAVESADAAPWARTTSALGAAAGLALLTQIRYENVLFLLPPAIYVFVRRRGSLRALAPAALFFTLLIFVYAFEVLRWGSTFQNPIRAGGLHAATREVFGNPIFAIGPVLVGTAAVLLGGRGRLRLLAPLPLLAAVPLSALANTQGHHLARTYINELLLLLLVAGYGLSLMWASPRRAVRAAAVGCVVWAAALPLLFWTNFRERHLETADHDFFRAAVASLPPDIDRVVVPDDDRLYRESHSTIESQTKYRMIAHAAGARGIEVVGMTRFLEQRDERDCDRGNCAFFRGVLCMGIARYWFAEAGCAQIMAMRTGAPVREEDVIAGSFVDCSIYRGDARRQLCDPVRVPQRLGLYRITN